MSAISMKQQLKVTVCMLTSKKFLSHQDLYLRIQGTVRHSQSFSNDNQGQIRLLSCVLFTLKLHPLPFKSSTVCLKTLPKYREQLHFPQSGKSHFRVQLFNLILNRRRKLTHSMGRASSCLVKPPAATFYAKI